MDDGEAEDLSEAAAPPSEPISDIVLSAQPSLGSDPGEWFVERAKFIPLRLTFGERKYLRLLDASLQVSEYTDKIDTLGFGLSCARSFPDSSSLRITSRARNCSPIAISPRTLSSFKKCLSSVGDIKS